jgi:hypothetical protein
LKESLESRAWSAAAAFDLAFAPGCSREVVSRIDAAVVQMEHSGQLTEPDRLLEAQDNLARLVEAMVDAAKSGGMKQLQEQTLRQALDRLCPLFPFC